MKVLIVFLLLINLVYTIDVTIIVPVNVKGKYESYMDGKNPLLLTELPHSNRDIAELVMVQQAIVKGGLEVDKFIIISGPTNDRIMATLGEGKADLKGTSAWYKEINKEKLLITTPSVDKGEFIVGFYTSTTNYKALEADSKEDIRGLTFVSSSQWIADWATLQKLKPAKLEDTPLWKNMVNLVGNNRIDILLAPFQSSDDMSFNSGGYTFIPIPNLKIALVDTRNFVVSKDSLHSLIIYNALNKGLELMREEGLITKFYTDSGFYNEKVEDWILIK